MNRLDEHLAPHLEPSARDRLDALVQKVRADPSAISAVFPAVARVVARGPSDPRDPEGIRQPRLEDQARVVLLAAVADAWRDQPGLFDAELAELYAEVGGYMQMEGREVFRRAVRVMVGSANKSLTEAGISADDIDLVVPHQANIRIIESACSKLGVSMDRTAQVLHSTGNTSAASIPLALVDALEAGRVSPGDHILLVGFGAGMTWASAVLRW
jgi:3-oxoacyl-[acyl-carrier-protein] synthase-3